MSSMATTETVSAIKGDRNLSLKSHLEQVLQAQSIWFQEWQSLDQEKLESVLGLLDLHKKWSGSHGVTVG